MQGREFDFELKKCYFMVKKRIVLLLVISYEGIEVDKVKID